MATVDSKISRREITSTAKVAGVASRTNLNPTSKVDFNPASKYEGPIPTSIYRGEFNPIMSIAERNAMMFPDDDITMEEIVAECKAVRQQMYEKKLMAQHGN